MNSVEKKLLKSKNKKLETERSNKEMIILNVLKCRNFIRIK